MAQNAVNSTERLHNTQDITYAVIARRIGIPEATLRRWRGRNRRAVALLAVPGPKKAGVDMGALMQGMEALHHARYRSYGAPALWFQHRDGISRRDFYDILVRYRARLRAQEREGWWRYRWLKVGAVWSVDDIDFGIDEYGQRLKANNVMDVGSKHLFEPLDGAALPAVKVAGNLDGLFRAKGVPVFLKSDLGTNLISSPEVSTVLSNWCVIPILSPPRYPQYNGVMERGQSDVRRAVEDLLSPGEPCPRKHFRAYAVAGTYRANLIRRDILGGQTACHVFSTRGREMKTTIPERRAIYTWIKGKYESILSEADVPVDKWAVNAAWRSAAEEWLLQNKVIEIIPGTEKVSTNFGDYERS